MEYIVLAFGKDSTSTEDYESIVKQLLEQYNSRAERVGLKKFLVSMGAHHSGDNMECCTISLRREVSMHDCACVFTDMKPPTLHATAKLKYFPPAFLIHYEKGKPLDSYND